VRLPGDFGLPTDLGLVGITGTTGMAAWLEFALLRRGLNRRIGRTGLSGRTAARLWGAAGIAGVLALCVKWLLTRWRGPMPGLAEQWGGGFLPPPRLHPALAALPILGVYGLVYLALAFGTAPGGFRASVTGLLRRRG
jgi:putative peptidoglycan lipid II flippase